VCPWNSFSKLSEEQDFETRNGLDRATLVELFAWTEAEFDERLRGSPIRRIGYERWLRNLAVGLGNAPSSPDVINALSRKKDHPSALVREHVHWALSRHDGTRSP
jgi:epoxyqueuosine reductase